MDQPVPDRRRRSSFDVVDAATGSRCAVRAGGPRATGVALLSALDRTSGDGHVHIRDRGEATVWAAVAVPLLMVAAFAVVVVVWIWTGPLIAMVAFAALCSAAVAGAAAVRRHNRGE